MKNSRYSIVVVIRVILISLNCLALVWLYEHTNRPATTLFAFVLLVFQASSLIYYHNRVNRDLANFLIFLQENDTSLAFSKQKIERSFQGLIYHLDRINQKLQAARIDREQQFHYLQTLIKQIDTGILAYDQNGKVELFNQAAQELLGIRSLRSITTLHDLYPELAGNLIPVPRISSGPLRITSNGKNRMLALKATSLRFNDRIIHLVSLQDIKPELDAGELDAWRKLMRVQRHEIINSITPITTLTTAIKRRFKKGDEIKKPQDLNQDSIADALNSIDVIEDRSRGLIDFVERFRSLTNVPELKITVFQLKRLIDKTIRLFSKDLKVRKIAMKITVDPENMMIHADEKLLEQVMINLVKNSLEAINHPGGKIVIQAYSDPHNHCVIQVADNGMGIDQTDMESIFIPSFTTKDNGSGIGLSISRQIIQMHNGAITVRSIAGGETVFEVTLPKQ
jgi:nitrogen fixation/metabolism regulation signal transduction histidine kinase